VDALRAASVQLFVERASAASGGYELSDADAPAIAEICRKLDGIPLAIELAAGRTATIGLGDLNASLGDSLQVLAQGRRTALPRHQTLHATLDWSYQLLTPPEKTAFRRLAVFQGNIPVAAARAVVMEADLPPEEIDELVRSLAAKSLVLPEFENQGVRYRLLSTTRAFSLEKLREAGEEADACRRHGTWMRTLFERAQEEWHTSPSVSWLSKYRNHLPNLRAALEWMFGPGANPEGCVELTIAAIPLWFELSAVDECLMWVERALAIIEKSPLSLPKQQMQLYAALGWPSRAVSGLPCGAQAWEKSRALAMQLGDRDFQLRALWAIWVAKTNAAQPREALDAAGLFCRGELEAGEPPEHRIGSRLRARCLHLLGRPVEAKVEVEKMLATYVAPTWRSHISRFQYEQKLTARITLGRALWVLGFPDRAMREMQEIVAEALSLGHILTLTHVLSDGACPIALLAGDIEASERFAAMLDAYTRANALDVWHAYAECFHGQNLIARGDTRSGIRRLNGALRRLEGHGFLLYSTAFLCALGEGFVATGQYAEGLASIDEAFSQCLRTGEAWCRPELLRVRGRLLAENGAMEGASKCYRQSLEEARAQGALSWMLRTATDLARLVGTQGDRAQASDMLAPVYAHFTEGFASRDIVAAAQLLQELGPR
jgi:predicted ATPase